MSALQGECILSCCLSTVPSLPLHNTAPKELKTGLQVTRGWSKSLSDSSATIFLDLLMWGVNFSLDFGFLTGENKIKLNDFISFFLFWQWTLIFKCKIIYVVNTKKQINFVLFPFFNRVTC